MQIMTSSPPGDASALHTVSSANLQTWKVTPAPPPGVPAGSFTIQRGQGARRLALEPATPVRLSEDSVLAFRFCAPGSAELRPDILRGDRGYPDVKLVNAIGTTYRFKRGNLKDFFDFERPTEPQLISLPLASFLFDIDARTNPPDTAAGFFAHPIRMIAFDFLAHPDRNIDVLVQEPRIVPQESRTQFDAFDLLIVENLESAPYLPRYVSYAGSIVLGVRLNAVGEGLLGRHARLEWSLNRDGRVLRRGTACIGSARARLQLELPEFGGYELHFATYDDAGLIAQGLTRLCRSTPVGAFHTGKLGISDWGESDQIAALGGTYERTVFSMTSVHRSGDHFAVRANSRALPVSPPPQGRRRIVALKGMPKYLSRNAEAPDYHRYGAADWNEYGRFIRWIASEIQRSGGWGIEIWNEASVIHEWKDGIENLIELQRVSYEAIKSVAPAMVVLSASTNTWNEEYLREITRQGIWRYCDALAVHGYTYDPHRAKAQFDEVETICAECSVAKGVRVPALITEIGFRNPAFSLQQQAEHFVLYSLEAAVRSYIDALLWFRLTNTREEGMSGYDQNASSGYAMLGFQGRYCRPTWAAYRFIVESLAGMQALGTLTAPDGARVYAFADPVRKSLLVGSFDETGTHALAAQPAQGLACHDIFGNRLSTPSGKLVLFSGHLPEQAALDHLKALVPSTAHAT